MAKTPTHQCEARTKNHGEFRCKRPAIKKVNGHWACKQHAKKKPPNGWM
jgi:hypothetical protein